VEDPAPTGTSRRTVLEGLGVVVVAGTAGYVGFVTLGPPPDAHLTGGDDGYEDEDEDHDNSGPGGGGDDNSGPGGGGDEDEGGGGAAGATALAPLADVPDGGGLVLQDAEIVLTRSGSDVRGFSAVCTHQGCIVASVSEGLIRCPCHGSRFDAATGEVVQGPARQALAPVAVQVEGDEVVRA